MSVLLILTQNLSQLFNAVKRVLSIMRSLPIVNTSDEEIATHINYVQAFESFVAVVADVMARGNLSCSTDQIDTWTSFLADTIKFHMFGESATAPEQSSGQYSLRMGESSKSVIQRCFDLIHLLLVSPGRKKTPSWDVWESLFASKGFTPVDAYFFLKYFGINAALYQSFENIAGKVKNGNRIVLM